MTACRKSFMPECEYLPECEYFTTGGCVSPFNCPYKVENESITTATSTPCNLYPLETDKDKEISRLQAEVAELRARLEKAVELQFSNGDEVYAIMDTLLYTGVFPVTIKSADVVYEVFDGEQITTQHRTRIFATRAEAEARLKELQGGER